MDRGIAPSGRPPRDPREKGFSLDDEPCRIGCPRENQEQAISADRRLYILLREELKAAGCFGVSHRRTAVMGFLVSALAAATYGGLLAVHYWTVRIILCALYGFAAIQGGFIGHEIGHRAAIRKDRWAAILGPFFMTILGGVAFAYFRDRHRNHHRHTNAFASDPDVQCAGSSVCPESVNAKGRA